jgi:hypothetical protein
VERSDDEVVQAAIEAGKRRYDQEHPPGPDVLPRDQWSAAPDEDGHRPYFTEDEVARSGEVFLPPEEARAFARDLYGEEGGFFLPEDALSALSLLSDELVERVRLLLRETHEQAVERVGEFRGRLERWHAEGSPPDDFPQRET